MSWRALIEQQHGVATTRQLEAFIPARSLERLVRDGVLERRQRGLYELGGSDGGDWMRRLFAALLALEPEGRWSLTVVAFGRTAAALWGLDGIAPGIVELATPFCGPFGQPCGVPVCRLRSLAEAHRTLHSGFPVTTPVRTLFDLGRSCDPDTVERSLEGALRERLVTMAQVQAALPAAKGLRGAAVLRSVLRRRPAGAPPTESDAETLFLQLVRRCGIPEPIRQFHIRVAGRSVFIDFAWPALWILVEIDGAATHATSSALIKDLERQNLLIAWAILRFTWYDVVHRPEYVEATIRRVWAAQAASPAVATGYRPPRHQGPAGRRGRS
jgi:very-short-patch-repair endonuclease